MPTMRMQLKNVMDTNTIVVVHDGTTIALSSSQIVGGSSGLSTMSTESYTIPARPAYTNGQAATITVSADGFTETAAFEYKNGPIVAAVEPLEFSKAGGTITKVTIEFVGTGLAS